LFSYILRRIRYLVLILECIELESRNISQGILRILTSG
jgi:hypothetical protein